MIFFPHFVLSAIAVSHSQTANSVITLDKI
jgi:hypothetical protein